MRKIFGFIWLLVATTSQATDGEKLILVCEGKSDPETNVRYLVTESQNKISLRKLINDTEMGRITIGSSASIVKWYGGTFILFENAGKSGYLLLHFNEPSRSSLIDINLFQPTLTGLNTRGPQRDFTCERDS